VRLKVLAGLAASRIIVDSAIQVEYNARREEKKVRRIRLKKDYFPGFKCN
jgi:hypothetical protein